MLEASLGNWAAPEPTVPLVGRVRTGGSVLIGGRWWALGGDRGSWLELGLFGIVGDRQGPGLSSTARDELGVFRDGQKSSGSVSVSALRALQEAQKFNTDVSPSVVPLLLCIFLPPHALLLSSHSKTRSPLHTDLHSLASSSVSDQIQTLHLPAAASSQHQHVTERLWTLEY